MQSTATGPIVIPQDSQSDLLFLDPSPFESSATMPPLVPAPPAPPAPPPAQVPVQSDPVGLSLGDYVLDPPPDGDESQESAEAVARQFALAPPPKGLGDLQEAARQVRIDLEALRSETVAANLASEVLTQERERLTEERARLCKGLSSLDERTRRAICEAVETAREDVALERAELARDRLQLSAERKTMAADRASLERAHAALAKLSGSFADARATLLEQVRVDVSMECEVRLAAQRRELLGDRDRFERDLETTQRRLARAQAQLVRSTEWLRDEGKEQGEAAEQRVTKAPAKRSTGTSKKGAPRRRIRRRF